MFVFALHFKQFVAAMMIAVPIAPKLLQIDYPWGIAGKVGYAFALQALPPLNCDQSL